jgi:hypothetical protein
VGCIVYDACCSCFFFVPRKRPEPFLFLFFLFCSFELSCFVFLLFTLIQNNYTHTSLAHVHYTHTYIARTCPFYTHVPCAHTSLLHIFVLSIVMLCSSYKLTYSCYARSYCYARYCLQQQFITLIACAHSYCYARYCL